MNELPAPDGPAAEKPTPMTATISLSADIDHSISAVWNAFADTDQRVRWGVPAGEAMVCDIDEFRTGGSIRARCGSPGALEFDSSGQYCAIEDEHFIVTTETLTKDGGTLSSAIITWTFTATSTGTRVDLVDQVVSFVGQGMIDGHRNGHEICLRQLGEFLSS
ncbi:SRPBCC domain-containing protein [Brevibacterium spongiae]|uniref:SRPBCC domain-containing protein n=1 Tax=Brevibacterium spongiae TaxID=2909672 RepID=A0ABY5SUD3_9MICO|nr:SRPBCC domain-containing protein [Brevibacterium spongiae]UVI37496.1 SRPBCC domain-containing protein [Brevibacterium spongiae]